MPLCSVLLFSFSLSMIYIVESSDIDKASKSLETAIAMDSSCLHAYEALASVELQRLVF